MQLIQLNRTFFETRHPLKKILVFTLALCAQVLVVPMFGKRLMLHPSMRCVVFPVTGWCLNITTLTHESHSGWMLNYPVKWLTFWAMIKRVFDSTQPIALWHFHPSSYGFKKISRSMAPLLNSFYLMSRNQFTNIWSPIQTSPLIILITIGIWMEHYPQSCVVVTLVSVKTWVDHRSAIAPCILNLVWVWSKIRDFGMIFNPHNITQHNTHTHKHEQRKLTRRLKTCSNLKLTASCHEQEPKWFLWDCVCCSWLLSMTINHHKPQYFTVVRLFECICTH